MEKKILVSDYDGTLFSDLSNLHLNICAIKEFREKGNLFVISTGRTYKSIMGQIETHKIPYDYVMCNDGLVLFDKEGNILNSHEMDKEHIKEIVELAKEDFNIEKILFYGNHSEIKISNSDDIDNNTIVELQFRKRFLKDIRKSITFFEKNYPSIGISKYGRDYFIKEKFTKKDGLDFLVELLNDEVKKENVITVGDNKNDLEMLKEYNGYKVLSSYPCMYGKGIKTTREVHTLIKKINK